MTDASKQSEYRYMVAIAGPPASGKSTLAENLCTLINQKNGNDICDVIPMDGFHLDNAVLDDLQILHRKGAVNTFDSNGFVALIKSLHYDKKPISIPLFDRESDAVIQGKKIIHQRHQILIIEGNYLLLNVNPWSQLHEIYDYKISLNVDIETIKERLIERWQKHGYNLEGAKERAYSNDIPNAEYVINNSGRADLIF